MVTWTENIEGGQQTDKDKQLDLHKAGREDVRMVRERQADTIKKEKEVGDCVANSTSYEINFILFFFFLAVQWKKNSTIHVTKCFELDNFMTFQPSNKRQYSSFSPHFSFLSIFPHIRCFHVKYENHCNSQEYFSSIPSTCYFHFYPQLFFF